MSCLGTAADALSPTKKWCRSSNGCTFRICQIPIASLIEIDNIGACIGFNFGNSILGHNVILGHFLCSIQNYSRQSKYSCMASKIFPHNEIDSTRDKTIVCMCASCLVFALSEDSHTHTEHQSVGEWSLSYEIHRVFRPFQMMVMVAVVVRCSRLNRRNEFIPKFCGIQLLANYLCADVWTMCG